MLEAITRVRATLSQVATTWTQVQQDQPDLSTEGRAREFVTRLRQGRQNQPQLVTVTGLPSDATADFVPQIDQALGNLAANLTAAGADVKSIGRIVMLIDDSAMAEYRSIYATRGSPLGPVWKKHLGKHFAAMAAIGVPSLENGAKVKFVVEAVGGLGGKEVGDALKFYAPGKGYFDAASVGDTILSGGAVGWNNTTQKFERFDLFGQIDVALGNLIGAIQAAGGDAAQIDQITAFVVGGPGATGIPLDIRGTPFRLAWRKHFGDRPYRLTYREWAPNIAVRMHDLRNGATGSRFLAAHVVGYEPVTLNLVHVSSLVESDAQVEVLARVSRSPGSGQRTHATRVRTHLSQGLVGRAARAVYRGIV